MNVPSFVQQLTDHRVELWLEGEKLCYRAPREALLPEVLSALKAHKSEIIAYLESHSDTTFPLAPGQAALWFLQRLDAESCAYNIGFAQRMVSPVDVVALREAFQFLINRHPALRTVFLLKKDGPLQQIRAKQPVFFEVIDASGWSDGELRLQVQRAYRRPFRLGEAGELFRVSLFRHAPDQCVLLLTVHHVVFDAWSLWLLLEELRDTYSAVKAGRVPVLPRVRSSYADFITAQRKMLEGSEGIRLLEFWRRELVEPLPVLNLPTDRPHPARRTTNGSSLAITLRQDLVRGLKQLAQREDVTVYMLLLAGLQILLHRYCRQDDLLIGVPMSGRGASAFARTVGYFVNPIVVRSRLQPCTKFRQFLQQTRQTVIAAIAHQDYPFAVLVDKLGVQRDISRSPVFQAMFVFQQLQHSQALVEMNAGGGDAPSLRWGELELAPFELYQQEGQFELTLELVEAAASLIGAFKYNTDLLEAETVARMAQGFENLLTAIVRQPTARVAELSLLGGNERQRIVDDWNATQRDYPLDTCLHRRFEEQVRRSPEAIAVQFEDEQVTYCELNQRANQLAHFLCRCGVGPEVLVGVCAERSIELVVALYGILKAGGAYVPLDPSYPADRLVSMSEDSGVKLILTQQRLAGILTGFGVATFCLDREWELAATFSSHAPSCSAGAENLAYVIYTSGSTGKPKGVMVSHRSICNRLLWMQDEYQLTAHDNVLQKTPFSFDVSVWEFFWPLWYGARLVIARPGGHRDSAYLLRLINEQQITTLHFVPSMLHVFLEEPAVGACTSLRNVMCSGEALPFELQRRFYELLNANLHNLYGPTEAAVDVTYWACQRQASRPPVPIGRPISNTQIYLLDSELQPVPVDVPGELYIGGVNLARGYLHRPDLTAERFIPNPFRASAEARLYKTGDLGRYRGDGSIELLGRLDHQVKIRGFRVELGEIESVLDRHPAVQHSVVVLREDRPGDKRLVAYAACGGANARTRQLSSQLREHLVRMLPSYMVPSALVVLDSLPLTANGKVDRRALPAPEREGPPADYVASRNHKEAFLCKVWAEVLGVEKVSIHDNFFALGGDSILCIQVVIRANREGMQLSVAQTYQHQTVAELAAVADRERQAPAQQDRVTGPQPLTPIQAWFFERDFVEPQHFNQSILLDVRADTHSEFVAEAVASLVRHHDVLRLRFSRDAGCWHAVHEGSPGTGLFSSLDLSSQSSDEQQRTIEASAAAYQASLDFEQGPLIRAVLFHLGGGRPARLLLVVHHLAFDAVSWRILLDDLKLAYQRAQRGEPVSLPAKTTSYQRWAECLQDYADWDSTRNELDFWLAQSYPGELRLPVELECPAPGVSDHQPATVTVSLSLVSTDALLKKAHHAYRTEINDVLLTAVLKGFEAWTGNRSLPIELEAHGRENLFDEVDVTRTVGWFTLLYPLLLCLGGTAEPGEELKTVKEQLRRVPRRGLGYGVLRYLSKDAAVHSKLLSLPRPEVRFNYLGQFHDTFTGGLLLGRASEHQGPQQSPRQHLPYVLDINAYVIDGRLGLDWTYSQIRYTRPTVVRLAEAVNAALESVIEHCLSPEAGGFTPSDFPAARLGADRLGAFIKRIQERHG